MYDACVLSVVLTMAVGAMAGVLGALLGLGGGVFLVPFLNLVLGLPMTEASGISLVTVIATSSVTSATPGRLGLVNLRLGMVLEVFTTIGGLIGLVLVHRYSETTLQLAFAWVLAVVAVVMLTRLDRRNIIDDCTIDVGSLGGRVWDQELNRLVAYRLKRPVVAFVVSFVAGVVSMLGIGGGVLKVPALNAWCGVPLRVAAATSALMIAATSVVGAIGYFAHGHPQSQLAAGAVLGVLAGSRAGFAIGARSNLRALKILMAAILAAVAALFFLRAGR